MAKKPLTPNQLFYSELERQIRLRLDRLQHCSAHIEGAIADDKLKCADLRGTRPDDELGKILYHLEYVLGNTSRYTLLVGVCSILEQVVVAIGKKRVPDKGTRDRTLRHKSLKGKNWLRKYVHLLTTKGGFVSNAVFDSKIDQFSDLIQLRNCIVHCWGEIAKDLDPNELRNALKRIKRDTKSANLSVAVESKDGFLILQDNAVAHALCLADEITEVVCDAFAAIP